SWRNRNFRNPIIYLLHTLSPLLSVTGGRITKVACIGTRPQSYVSGGMPFRDMQQAIMYNSDDVLFSVRASFTMPHGHNDLTGNHWYQIKGTGGSSESPRSTLDTGKLWTPTGGWKELPQKAAADDLPGHAHGGHHGGADWWPIEVMADAILNDTQPPMDVYKAVEIAAPAILAVESCEKGGVMLDVPDFRNRKTVY
ncbi:MAG: hypothetical protein FWD53_06755, partial [Phycisphaerales bacterium]|nr:hypothetical protein [Phycisphaerales bacterium]